jgi:mannuronan synthase
MSQVAHEAEVQRQHTRYRIPLRCELGGTTFEVNDWSIGGLSLKDPPADLRIGHKEALKLSFPFSDYAIGISVDAEPRYIDGANKRAGLKFVNVTRRQADVLRFMIDAYLSGEVVEAKDLIEVSARRNEARARAVPEAEAPATVRGRVSRGMGRAVRFGAAGLGGLVLLGFIGTGLYERLFVVPAQSAIVTTDLLTVPAPLGGSVAFLAQTGSVKRGEPVAAVESLDGKSSILASPCDCDVQVRFASLGDFVTPGVPIISLRRQESKPYVAAFVPRDQIMRIYDSATARVVLTNGRQFTEKKMRVVPANEQSAHAPGSNELVKVIIDLSDEADFRGMIGQPARVFFETGMNPSITKSLISSVVRG